MATNNTPTTKKFSVLLHVYVDLPDTVEGRLHADRIKNGLTVQVSSDEIQDDDIKISEVRKLVINKRNIGAHG